MGSGFSKMKKQARMMQQQMEQVREEMKSKEVTGKSGNGLVTIILDGERNIKDLKIKPECVDPEDTEGLEDLIRAAYEEATSQLGDESDLGGMLPF
ncbi:MAG: Nucleoid-associated protein [Chlamydiae bacterium]|nr:Nucleoid-associated protein [Chlamydiota bacterium]